MKKMKCPKCLNEVQEDNFCVICGAKLREKCKCWVLKGGQTTHAVKRVVPDMDYIGC